MASLERNQVVHNSHIANASNVTGSNDPRQQALDAAKLTKGAEFISAARTLGMTDDQLLLWLNSRKEIGGVRKSSAPQETARLTPEQKLAQLTNTLGALPVGEPDGARTVSNAEADLLLAGGEKTQDTIQNFGGFDPTTGRQKNYSQGAEELARARGSERDLNAFSVSVKVPGTEDYDEYYRQKDVYIEDGRPTPASFRQAAMLRDAGIGMGDLISEEEVDVEVRPKGGLQGAIETQRRKRKVFEANLENNRPTGSQSSAPSDALERLLVAVDNGEIGLEDTISIAAVNPEAAKITGDKQVKVSDLISNLRGSATRVENGVNVTERARVRAERDRGRQAVREDSRRFNVIQGLKNQLAYESEYDALVNSVGRNVNAQQGSINIARMGETPLPGGLTAAKSTTDSYYSAAQSALSQEAMARRPQAIQLEGDAREVAQSLGLSEYVDKTDTDRSIPTTGMGTAGEALNAPGPELTRTGRFIAEHAYEPKGQDAQLTQANISQAQADWARNMEAHAPGYRHKPITTIEELETQIGRVISARQAAGKNFYIKSAPDARGRVRNQRVDDPGIAEVLQLFRMGPQDQQNLANAIYQQELGRAQSNFGPQPRIKVRDNVTTGSMFGSEDINLTRARDSQAARFSSIPSSVVDSVTGERFDTRDAQMPFIASQGPKETPRSRMVTKDPVTGKARTPDEAVQAYVSQRTKNKKEVDSIYAEKIRRDNRELRQDQANLEAQIASRESARVAAAAPFNLEGSTDTGLQRVSRATAGAQERYGFDRDLVTGAGTGHRAPIEPAGKLVSLRPQQRTSAAPTQYYDGGSSEYDVATRFSERSGNGGNGGSPPRVAAMPAPEPEPTNRRMAIGEHLKNNRRKYGYGAAGAGALAALTAALTGGREQEEAIR